MCEVKVKGPRFENLTELAGVLKSALSQIDGVYDIRDDFSIGKSELRIYLESGESISIWLNHVSGGTNGSDFAGGG